MERRRRPRSRRRLTCELVADGIRHHGIVRDLSAVGLFVQTAARLAPGTRVAVELRKAGRGTSVLIEARVARQRRVPANLVSVSVGGIGLDVVSAPPEYYAMAAGETVAATATPPKDPGDARAEPEPTEPSFRVRLQQRGGPRSRTLVVQASDLEAARTRARRQAGETWQVLEVEPL